MHIAYFSTLLFTVVLREAVSYIFYSPYNPTHFDPEDRSNKLVYNVGIILKDYLVSQHLRPQSESCPQGNLSLKTKC
jgi:hypothetical protein